VGLWLKTIETDKQIRNHDKVADHGGNAFDLQNLASFIFASLHDVA